MNPSDNYSNALGAFGPGVKVAAGGKEWSFVFDIPAVVAEMEEMCSLWHRQRYEKELSTLKDRDRPGSFDNQCAAKLFDEFRAELRNGETMAPRLVAGQIVAGRVYDEWQKTPSGRTAMLLAALRIKHPGATPADLNMIVSENPDKIHLMLEELGNAARDLASRMANSLTEKNPELATKMQTEVDRLEGLLTSSQR